MSSATDERFMRAALALGARGLGRSWPNPSVGCVLVRDGRVVGRGWTQPGGRPHAETEALRRAGALARGATAYVTLEPCANWGRTPPCCRALAEAGVARVVVGCIDPDPRTNGKGVAFLREAGIEVVVGCLEDEARRQSLGLFRRIFAGRPMVTLKLALSLDGRIATRTGHSQWISGERARLEAHLLRATHDAVLVGSGTVLADDPALTCRIPGLGDARPLRIVLDRRLRTPPSARLFAGGPPVLVFTRRDHQRESAEKLRARGAEVVGVDEPYLPNVLDDLARRGLTRLLVEGGARVAAAFLAERLVDRLCLVYAPILLGGDAHPGIADLALDEVGEAPRFRVTERRSLDQDTLVELEAVAGE
ncbi:Riboflavin biosynthesis protein RibD [bacterium HR40]|nr:Riboflavin biosynthesis protein RibD [bacterium HR40]